MQRTGSYQDYLGKKGYYWGEISQPEAKEFLANARKRGYKKAVAQLGVKIPGFFEYVLSSLRADWVYDAINLKNTKRALDIGSGWGAIVFSLSNIFDEVTSLEAVKERLDFQQIRASQEKRKNIKFVRADWLKLPFKDNTFDLVSCNGVLEWIGLSDFSKNPKELQIIFLKEVKRVLKPDGVLYIGIENRFAAFLFLGAKDHSGLPFTSLLPRSIADLVIRKFRKTGGTYSPEIRTGGEWPDYRTYTYSKSGYGLLLQSAGFKNVSTFWTIAYNSPSDAGPIDSMSFPYLLSLFKNHNFYSTYLSHFVTSVGSWLPGRAVKEIVSFFSPNFLLYGSNTKKTSFSRELVGVTGAESFLRRSGTHGLNSKINYFLLKNGKPFKIAKFSRFDEYSTHLDLEESLLSKWSGLNVDLIIIQGKKVYLEPYIEGRVCQTFSWGDNKTSVAWLVHFQRSTVQGNWTKRNFTKFLKTILKSIKSNNLLGKKVYRELEEDIVKVSRSSEIEKMPRVRSHGDFVKTNIIFDKLERIFVIDWEFSEVDAFPIFDFLFFLINNSLVGKSDSVFKSNWTGSGPYSEILQDLLQYYSRESSVTTNFIIECIPWVMAFALHRRVADKYMRHLDLETYIKLIEKWYEVKKDANSWLSHND
ncbi:MAG: Type 11 methyltransferase [Candidatus Woesebacteria bacterium GW2011_GWB1_38_5b]|uniref:Type 11 methyltransferase n=1 Tax=Candidatus Woesebacteria bacterium GW2011_GWB1_38_5b TaxID=1618569 RepID=A0A0G0MPW7_9BACT|nr:MAG: Type 11 methyltransferase [Candidatus Woesebacteria bacterium GW2011_GWB1_38_5b]